MRLQDLVDMHNLSNNSSAFGTDKGTTHTYLSNVYNQIFEIKQLELQTIVEIGVASGASLALWKLAKPRSFITGFDIEKRELHPKCKEFLDSKSIQIIYKDGYDLDIINNFKPVVDLLIDDGPHTLRSQINCLAWINRLSPTGTLVIEDIAGGIASVKEIMSHLPKDLRKRCIFFTTVHKSGRYDDTVLVFTNSDLVKAKMDLIANQFAFWGSRGTLSWRVYAKLVRLKSKW